MDGEAAREQGEANRRDAEEGRVRAEKGRAHHESGRQRAEERRERPGAGALYAVLFFIFVLVLIAVGFAAVQFIAANPYHASATAVPRLMAPYRAADPETP